MAIRIELTIAKPFLQETGYEVILKQLEELLTSGALVPGRGYNLPDAFHVVVLDQDGFEDLSKNPSAQVLDEPLPNSLHSTLAEFKDQVVRGVEAQRARTEESTPERLCVSSKQLKHDLFDKCKLAFNHHGDHVGKYTRWSSRS